MSDLPVPRSAPQILGEMIDSVATDLGISRLKPGNPILSVLEASARSDVRTSHDVLKSLLSRDADQQSGQALIDAARLEGLPILTALRASGTVTISDTSFTKISSQISGSKSAPVVGSTSLYVDVANYPSSGSVVVGRGTDTVEGPLAYTSVVDHGTYLELVLAGQTTRFHNWNDSVVLAQGGDRLIAANTVITTAISPISSSVSYTILFDVVLATGETSVDARFIAKDTGSASNAAVGAINTFPTPPFSGASIRNALAITNGRDQETENDLKQRLKAWKNSKNQVSAALESRIIGTKSTDQGTSVTSAQYVKSVNGNTLFIDNGSGYQMESTPIAIEELVASALGGESEFQTAWHQVTKAQLTTGEFPVELSDSVALSIKVGQTISTHYFDTSSFRDITNANAYEFAAAVNSNSSLGWTGRVVGNRVVIEARGEQNDQLEVISAPTSLDLSDKAQTLLLYKNDRLLSKDGYRAQVIATAHQLWNEFGGTQDLHLGIDGTPVIQWIFTDQDFQDAGFGGLSRATAEEWAYIIDAKIPGVTVTVVNNAVVLTSNQLGADSELKITGGTLVANQAFAVQDQFGQSSDYALDRSTGQIMLATPLAAGDKLSLGSTSPRAFIGTSAIPTTTIVAPDRVVVTTSATELVTNGLSYQTPLTTEVVDTTNEGYIVAINATVSNDVFDDLAIGDTLVARSTIAELDKPHRISGVNAVGGYYNQITVEQSGMFYNRTQHKAVVLANGVLVCGGYTADSNFGAAPNVSCRNGTGATDTVEFFNTTTKEWTLLAPMARKRARHTAVALNNDTVFVAGGVDENGVALASTEIYTYSTNTWTSGPLLAAARYDHTATLLVSGRVLVVGGTDGVSYFNTSYEYNSGTNTFINASTMGGAHFAHKAVSLALGAFYPGHVLICGGYSASGTPTLFARRYDVSGFTWTTMASMTTSHFNHGFGLLNQAYALVVGSALTGGGTTKYQVLDINANTWLAEGTLPGGFIFKNQDLVNCGGSLLALYGSVGTGVTTEVAHLKFVVSGTPAVPTITTLANSVFRGPRKEAAACVALSSTDAFVCGGSVNNTTEADIAVATAAHEQFNTTTGWSYPNVLDNLTSLDKARFVRGGVRQWDIPVGTYTAALLNDTLDLSGLLAQTYKTTRSRLFNNSHGGSILLVDQPSWLDFETTPQSTDSYVAFLKSADKKYPQNLSVYYASGQNDSVVLQGGPFGTGTVFGLLRTDGGENPYYWVAGFVPSAPLRTDEKRVDIVGNQVGLRAPIGSVTETTNAQYGALRQVDHHSYQGPAVVEAPVPWGADASIDATINGQDFVANMFRSCETSGNYGSTITLTDGADTIAKAFGLNYDFRDHEIRMAARTKSHSADASKRILWRYPLLGALGEDVVFGYTYPEAADTAPVWSSVDRLTTGEEGFVNNYLSQHLRLRGGAAKTDHVLRSATRIGFGRTNTANGVSDVFIVCGLQVVEGQRTGAGANGNRLRVQIPTGLANCGLVAGNAVWFEAAVPDSATLYSGLITLTLVDPPSLGLQDIYFNGAALNGGGVYGPSANVGTISFDPTGETSFDLSLVQDDYVRIDSGYLPAAYCNTTMRIDTATKQYLKCRGLDLLAAGNASTLVWTTITDTARLKTFGKSTDNATALAAVTGGLAGTVTGTGAGIINKSSWDELGSRYSGYYLTDGLNYVRSTVDPLFVTNNTQFVLDRPITSDLQTNSDWANEVVHIVPVLPHDIVEWLNCRGVSGIGSAAEIVLTSDHQVQISSLLSGSAGSVSIESTDLIGSVLNSDLCDNNIRLELAENNVAKGHIRLLNTEGLPKEAFWDANTTAEIEGNTWDLSDPPYLLLSSINDLRIQIEVVNDLVLLTIPKEGNSSVPSLSFGAGDYVYLTVPNQGTKTTLLPDISDSNTGTFRVLFFQETNRAIHLWFRNDNAVTEKSVCKFKHLDRKSAVSGDTWEINDDTFGTANNRIGSITSVGGTTEEFLDSTITVSGSTTTSTTTFGTALVTLRSAPEEFIKTVENSYGDFLLVSPSDGYDRMGAGAGTVLHQYRLGFGTASTGVDSYGYDNGLAYEASKTLYEGGLAATGANILVAGPRIRRISVGLAVQLQSGSASTDLADRVRSAVAAVINNSPIGKPIAIGNIVAAAQNVVGVVAVAVIDPTYNSSNAVIPLGAGEKGMILDLQDVGVVFIGD
jgi:hypothetical protein